MEFILIPTNTDGLIAKFDASAEMALDPLEPFSRIVDDMYRAEAALFNSGGRRGGGSWKPLKDDTAKRKGSSQILVDTGALRDSLSVPGAAYQILEITKSGLVFGTDRPFAAVQNFGSAYHNRPARPIMKFTQNDLSRWTHWLAEFIIAPFTRKI